MPKNRLRDIEGFIAANKGRLDTLQIERRASRSLPARLTEAHPMLVARSLSARTFRLVAQGDSWFDYPPSWDTIDWLSNAHGHDIDNIAVAGSTLNDIVYGPVPKNWLGIRQSDDVSRRAELVHRIDQKRPHAVLLSGGGNDIAGKEFFPFINNAISTLQNPNQQVLDGVVAVTFRKAYEDLIDLIVEKATQLNTPIHIFLHGYDYPWPDGRGFTMFNLVGPWFHETFNEKNYPYADGDSNAAAELQVRHSLVAKFIDSFNVMLSGIAGEGKYRGLVHHVDLRGTLQSKDEWANELHPTREGFGKLAAKIDLSLHATIP